jgi:hypothetical protein
MTLTVLKNFTRMSKNGGCLKSMGHRKVLFLLYSGNPSLFFLKKMVGMGRLELPTSRLSVVRSSQLSYTPIEMNNSLHDLIKVCSFENWWRLADSNR